MPAKETVQGIRNRHGYVKIITRQQFSGALLEPLMDLVSVTGRAVPVTAGMIDINLLAATLTLVNMPAGICPENRSR
jgi:hypothetical protein